MIPPLVSKVNPFHLADFAAHCACSAVEAADLLLRQAPDEEEDEEEDEDERKKEDNDDDDDETDDGYSE